MQKNFEDFCEKKAAMLVDALKKGRNPFGMPFSSGFVNPVSGNHYDGMNPMWLNFHNMFNGFKSPYFVTWKHAKQLAEKQKVKIFVKPDQAQNYCALVKWGFDEVEKKDKEGKVIYKDGQPETETKVWFSPFNVYNIEQTNLDFSELVAQYEKEIKPIADVKNLLDTYIERVGITVNVSGNGCFYRKTDDSINMLPIGKFVSSESYHMVQAHELGHSTGIESRLKRECYALYHQDQRERAKEELAVQLFACSFAGYMGIDSPDVDGFTENYVNSWISLLTEKPEAIYTAMKQAVQMWDFMFPTLATKKQPVEKTEKKKWVGKKWDGKKKWAKSKA